MRTHDACQLITQPTLMPAFVEKSVCTLASDIVLTLPANVCLTINVPGQLLLIISSHRRSSLLVIEQKPVIYIRSILHCVGSTCPGNEIRACNKKKEAASRLEHLEFGTFGLQ